MFSVQVAPIEMLLGGQLMSAWSGQYKRLKKQRNYSKRRVDKRVRCDDGVQLPSSEFTEQLLGKTLSQEEIEFRVPFAQRREQVRQQIRPNGCDGTQPWGARQWFLSGTGDSSDLCSFLQHDSRLIRHSFSGRRDGDPAVSSLE